MKHTSQPLILPSEIPSETQYRNRRQFLREMGLGAGLGLLGVNTSSHALTPSAGIPSFSVPPDRKNLPPFLLNKIAQRKHVAPPWTVPGLDLTPYSAVTTYNNFYEFGTAKTDPAENAGTLRIDPWKIQIDGLCDKPGNYTLEDILAPHTLEDRIYRFRCVEAWSMVVPWLGFPLAALIKRFQPKSTARFVEFTTLEDSNQLPGQRSNTLDWPYVEGLRLDEAMHPLTLLAVGVYGRSLPDQNGAPIRLIVPWKYGFKSIKSIVRIRFTEKAPVTTWLAMAPSEYGFYANVNPAVDHPRWSQSRERVLPLKLFQAQWKDTLLFNGYAAQVASLYKGMNLKRFY